MTTFTKFEHEGKIYLSTGTLQLYQYGMCSRQDILAEPSVLNEECLRFLIQHDIQFGDNLLTGCPTFIFDTPSKLLAFEERYHPKYRPDDQIQS